MRALKAARAFLLALMLLSLVSFWAVAATNTVDNSHARYQNYPVTVDQLKPPECYGITLTGTLNVADNGNNLLIGTTGADSLDGLGGDDCIIGGDGNDRLDGGNGNDVVLGGNGNDRLDENNSSGIDTLIGGGGNNDRCWRSDPGDTIDCETIN